MMLTITNPSVTREQVWEAFRGEDSIHGAGVKAEAFEILLSHLELALSHQPPHRRRGSTPGNKTENKQLAEICAHYPFEKLTLKELVGRHGQEPTHT
jgi:hypothetical protein